MKVSLSHELILFDDKSELGKNFGIISRLKLKNFLHLFTHITLKIYLLLFINLL